MHWTKREVGNVLERRVAGIEESESRWKEARRERELFAVVLAPGQKNQEEGSFVLLGRLVRRGMVRASERVE